MLARLSHTETSQSTSLLRTFILTLFLSLIATSLPLLYAQNPNGTLRGEVQDASSARIAGARITLESKGSSTTREATVNERGEFRIEGLLPGPYRVTVAAKGFAEATADVDVEVSVVRDITVTLTPGTGHETVTVQSSASSITTEPIDTARAVTRPRRASRRFRPEEARL